jgi:hypothetical protein
MKNDWKRVEDIHTQHESQSLLSTEKNLHYFSPLSEYEAIDEKFYSAKELRYVFLEKACNALTHNQYNFLKTIKINHWMRFLENCIRLCRFYLINQANNEQATLENNKLWLLLNRKVPLREKDTKAFQIFNQADCILLDEAYLLAERFNHENERNDIRKLIRWLINRSGRIQRILRFHVSIVNVRIENWITIAIARKQNLRQQNQKQMVNDYRNEQMSQITILQQCGNLSAVWT